MARLSEGPVERAPERVEREGLAERGGEPMSVYVRASLVVALPVTCKRSAPGCVCVQNVAAAAAKKRPAARS